MPSFHTCGKQCGIHKSPAKRGLFVHRSAGVAIEPASERWYARRSLHPTPRGRVEHATEPTAEGLWDAIARRLRRPSARRPTTPGSATRSRAPSATGGSSSPCPTTSRATGSRAISRASCPARPASAGREIWSRSSVARASAAGAAAAGPSRRGVTEREPSYDPRHPGARAQPEVHVRPLHHRLVEPLRACRRARRRGGAGPGVQPALHLRGHRLGKTHLLQAIGHYVRQHSRRLTDAT